MPPRRRDRIKRKLVAGCLEVVAAFCCCCCGRSRTNSSDGGGPEVEEEKAVAMESFVNNEGL